jgi:hypothetical protein
MLVDMRRLSSGFYYGAVQIGCHSFIEFCGLMNKYIDLCAATLKDGGDFNTANVHTGTSLVAAEHDIEYLAEKFECIFGTTLRANPKLADQFFKKVMA